MSDRMNQNQGQGQTSGQTQTQDQGQSQQGKRQEVEKALEGAPYPANREELAKYAESKGAEGEIVRLIRELPDVVYKTTDALTNALNKILPLESLKNTLGNLL